MLFFPVFERLSWISWLEDGIRSIMSIRYPSIGYYLKVRTNVEVLIHVLYRWPLFRRRFPRPSKSFCQQVASPSLWVSRVRVPPPCSDDGRNTQVYRLQ